MLTFSSRTLTHQYDDLARTGPLFFTGYFASVCLLTHSDLDCKTGERDECRTFYTRQTVASSPEVTVNPGDAHWFRFQLAVVMREKYKQKCDWFAVLKSSCKVIQALFSVRRYCQLIAN